MPVFVSAARVARICTRWPEKALIQDTPTFIDRDRTAHNLLNRNEFLGDWSG
jgi:hypothetical protein